MRAACRPSSAANRADLAFATGFVHAQDRFFEMDLSRRLAAGELAELFGQVALEQDRKARLFRFRSVARAVLAQATPAQRAMLRGLHARGQCRAGAPAGAALGVLAARPAAGSLAHEDSMLVEYAMWWDLQANGFRREILRREINARLGGPRLRRRLEVRAAVPLSARHQLGCPASSPIAGAAGCSAADAGSRACWTCAPRSPSLRPRADRARAPLAGSNSWAVAGRLTATGAALVANDMHLGQRVPTIWYHARLRLQRPGAAAALDLNGVTLPGTPLLVAGSNGHIAWGFTNSYGDWLDVSALACTAVAEALMHTPARRCATEVAREQIRVHGAASVAAAGAYRS